MGQTVGIMSPNCGQLRTISPLTFTGQCWRFAWIILLLLTSTQGSANRTHMATGTLSNLQPCSDQLWGLDAYSQAWHQSGFPGPAPYLAGADIRLHAKHPMRAVCHKICRAFPRTSVQLSGGLPQAVSTQPGLGLETDRMGMFQTNPPRNSEEELKSLLMRVKEESKKSWIKTKHSKN